MSEFLRAWSVAIALGHCSSLKLVFGGFLLLFCLVVAIPFFSILFLKVRCNQYHPRLHFL